MQLPSLSPGKRFTLPRPLGSADALLLARFAQREAQAQRLTAIISAEPADTLKQAQQGRVGATIDRAGKWAAQTPQMFRLGLLRPALAHAGDTVTDEASAIEALGHAPLLVEGRLENFKLTWPADFELAARLLRSVPIA